VTETDSAERAAFAQLLAELRPRLHRYCARMTGSVIDGEDAVQDALVKAVEAFTSFAALSHPEGWVFRIAHHAALDLLRRRARQPAFGSDEEIMAMEDPRSALDEQLAAAASVRVFMELTVAQRSCVVLMDVLGYSLDEIADITKLSVPAVKAALHRGRVRLRELAAAPPPTSSIAPALRGLLARYAERFNARDFDAIRDMLAEEVRLEVVARSVLHGRAAVSSAYFANYASATDWHFAPGLVEGRPAILVGAADAPPRYFILLEWSGETIVAGRDFRHATYAMDGAVVSRIE
jgi:RNA polymerase sigma-70 factor, ECF subfamily